MSADDEPPFVAGRPLVRAALAWAAKRHHGQSRAVDDAPLILHPAEVAALHARIERLTRHLAGRDVHIHDGSEATTGTPEPRARAEKSPRTDSTGPMVDGRLSPKW